MVEKRKRKDSVYQQCCIISAASRQAVEITGGRQILANLITITDLCQGKIQVSWQLGSTLTRSYLRQLPLVDPLSSEDRQELRWYLEEYLEFPYGAERDRARQVEQRMEIWGEALFCQVFEKVEAASDPLGFYQEAGGDGLDNCEVCIRSDDPAFLDIPWELLRDPTPGRGYLSPTLKGLYRQLSTPITQASNVGKTLEPFRVLLVIARKKDDPISMRSDARIIMRALRTVGFKIHVEVLRPPTFDEFQRRLNLQPGFFDLVHFDGHGAFFDALGDGNAPFTPGSGIGCLLFEKLGGETHVVNSHEIGQVLTNCRVPFFVLSACQSAEEGRKNPFSSVASQLIAVGASGVIGMSYSVHMDTAEKFIQRLYECLVNHSTLSEAVASARRRLFADPDRESVVGPMALRDWIIPRLYQQTPGIVPIPDSGSCHSSRRDAGADYASSDANGLLPQGQYGFIGRDQEILQIERALRNDDAPWILITGMGGVGKTDLAYGFGRWFAVTGGCPGGVYLTSFKAKGDFDHIVGSVAGFGTDFSSLFETNQFERISGFLQNNPCLLIWDNFETVAGYPSPAHSFATDEDLEKISALLRSLRGGKTRVIITTRRSEENWLGIASTPIKLEGLTLRDAARLAKEILRTIGRRPEEFRVDQKYVTLIQLLMGHPRSLEVVLPLLRNHSPLQIIEALQHQVDSSARSMTDASLEYAFSQMSQETRKHLPVLGLFSSFVHADSLERLTLFPRQTPTPKICEDFKGNTLNAEAWESVLEEAAGCGLLRSLGPRMYEIHPTVPIFLRRHLQASLGHEGYSSISSAFMGLYGRIASELWIHVQRWHPNAVRAAGLEEHNLLRALRLAQNSEAWECVQQLAQALYMFYEGCGAYSEGRGLVKGLLNGIGRRPQPGTVSDKAQLWMFLQGVHSNHAIQSHDFALAERGHQEVLDYLLSLNDSTYDRQIANAHLALGMVAQDQNRCELAENHMRQALEIFQRLGLEADVAGVHHNLSTLASQRNDLAEAEALCKKAGQACQRIGLRREAANAAVQLAVIKIKQGSFDVARRLCVQAANDFNKLGLKREAAQAYHNLGVSLQDVHQFDMAEAVLREAVKGFEMLGLDREIGATYHHLGINAHERKRFDLAEQWYKRAMEKLKPLRYAPLLVPMMAQLGALCHDQGQGYFKEGIQWLAKAFRISSDYKTEERATIVPILARFMLSMGRQNLMAAWTEACPDRDLPIDEITVIVERARNAEI